MKRVIWNSRRLFAVTIAALVIACLLPPKIFEYVTTTPRRIVEVVVVPVAHIGRWVSGFVRPTPRAVFDTHTDEMTRRDRDAAWTYARQLEADLARAKQALHDVGITRDILGPTQRTLVFASVAASNDSRTNPTLTINRGGNDKIRKGLFVTNGMSLVGQISEVTPVTSTVQLITRPNTYIGVRIVPPVAGRVSREVTTGLSFSKNFNEFTGDFDKNLTVQPGDLAHVAHNDPRYGDMRGFVVGKVTRVAKNEFLPLMMQVVVEPLVPLTEIDHVYVLVPPDASDAPSTPPGRGGTR